MEQRRFYRYNLSTPLTGLVEHRDERCAGSVINISLGGFFLHLPTLPTSRLATYGAGDYGEIQYAGRIAHGFGQIVRVENFAKSIGLGFAWDADEVNQGGCSLITEIIEAQEKMRQIGQVTLAATTLTLSGHVSSALAAQIFTHLKTLGASNARISLRNCTAIDSSGVEMLMTLRDMGATIIDAGAEIKSVVQRFQLLPPDAD